MKDLKNELTFWNYVPKLTVMTLNCISYFIFLYLRTDVNLVFLLYFVLSFLFFSHIIFFCVFFVIILFHKQCGNYTAEIFIIYSSPINSSVLFLSRVCFWPEPYLDSLKSCFLLWVLLSLEKT